VSLRAAVLKGGSQLVLGQVASQVFSFARNLIIARVISPADFGIAATFAMTLSLMEMISNVASEMLLVQSPDGDSPEMEGTAHLLRVGRGLVNACILFAIADPMSRLFGVPQARWAFQCLAVFPFASGFTHLDIYRVQREMRFMPSIWVTAGSNVLATLIAIPLALRFKDYSVMLWVLVLQATFSAAISHIVAERRYTWAWNKRYAASIFHFGWPLLINGLLMYGIFEGDRLVIGSANRLFPRSHFTLTDLGVYSVVFGLVMAPSLLASSVGTSLFLPILSQAQYSSEKFDERYLFVSQVISLLATCITVPFILNGGWAVNVLYGGKYAAASGFVGWIAAMWGIRIFRTAPTVAALSKGDTRNAMFANILRSLALLGMMGVAVAGAGLRWIPFCGFAGEILACSLTVWRLERRHGVLASSSLRPFLPFAVGIAAAGLAVARGATGWGPTFTLPTALLITSGSVGAMFILYPTLRNDCLLLINNQARELSVDKASVLN
jgi:O-antigen/teichoic acid export membrane protein